jgi:tRNA (guanine-N7-)-methyltransferase
MDYTVHSNQTGPHQHLERIVLKHLQTKFLRPISDKQHAIFQELNEKVIKDGRPIILDSCCGTGQSSVHFAAHYSDHLVIGIDKSQHRLQKQTAFQENLLLVRANVYDLWRLIAQHNWPIEQHYILYPNPWPKSDQFKQRFHGHPCFKVLFELSPYLEVRSNWSLYSEEFAAACRLAGIRDVQITTLQAAEPITAFESKYRQAGQELFQVQVRTAPVRHCEQP